VKIRGLTVLIQKLLMLESIVADSVDYETIEKRHPVTNSAY